MARYLAVVGVVQQVGTGAAATFPSALRPGSYPKDCSLDSTTLTNVPWLLGPGDPLGGLLPRPTTKIPESELVAETTADIVFVSPVPEPER